MLRSEDVFKLSDKRGSSAKTLQGAIRFIISHPEYANLDGHGSDAKWASNNRLRDYKDAAYNKRASRIAKALGLYDLDIAEELANKLSSVPEFPFYLYRYSLSPAKQSYKLLLDSTPRLEFSEGLEWGCYSRSCRYPAKSIDCTAYVTLRALQLLPKLVVSNKLLLDVEPIDHAIAKVVYVKQARGLLLEAQIGYLICGELIERTEKDAAVKLFAKRKGCIKLGSTFMNPSKE